MPKIGIFIILSLAFSCSAQISGPYLLWGHDRVLNLQPQALVEATEQSLMQLFKDAKAILIFVRNATTHNRLEGSKYPKFQNLVKTNAWSYLPQRNLAAEPFNYNTNIEIINLSGHSEEDDSEILAGYNDALTIFGHGEVLGILATREEEARFLAKREAKGGGEDDERTTTAQTPTAQPNPDETESSYVYEAEGAKAVLHVNAPMELRIKNESIKLVEHNKHITFDDQRGKGLGRLSILFMHKGDKCTLRFKFSLLRGFWHLRAVDIEYTDFKDTLPALGDDYTLPSAPLSFSFRCSARNLLFSNANGSLLITDYQVQPWLNGKPRFGEVYDCVGFTTAPIWAGLMVVAFLLGILSLGINAMLSIHPPNRFESSRNKQLTFTVQE